MAGAPAADSAKEVQRKELLEACRVAEEWLKGAAFSAEEVELKISSLQGAFVPVWAFAQEAGNQPPPKPEVSEPAPADALQIEMASA